MKYDSITEINIHGMQPEEAVKTVSYFICKKLLDKVDEMEDSEA